MRNIINISLPEDLAKEVKKEVKDGGFASTSEFFRDALRAWKRKKFIEEIEISKKEMLMGKGKSLRSLKDLR